MFWGILNSVLGSIAWVHWKKSLELSTLSRELFQAIGLVGGVTISAFLIFFDKVSIDFGNLSLLSLLFFLVFAHIYATGLQQEIYKNEKVSALMSYQNIASILTIVAAFFIFQDGSFASLGVAIFTMCLIFGVTIDLRSFTLPKRFGRVILLNSLMALRMLLLVYVFKSITSLSFFAFSSIASFLVLFAPILFSTGIAELKKGNSHFYTHRLLAAFLWQASALIAFFLMDDLGLVVTTLLGFLGMFISLIFWYFLLQDIPKRKDLFLAIVVSLLVFIGYSYK